MPVISNPKHEIFAQEIAKGASASIAYVTAGYSKNDGNASRLNGNEKVRERVQQLLEEGAERAGVTIQRIVDELAKIGFSNMLDYITVGANGDPYVDLSTLDRDKAAAIAEVTVEDFKDGRGEDTRSVRRIKFKLHDKKGALVDLGRHLKMFTDKTELSGPGGGPVETVSVISTDPVEAARIYQRLMTGG